MDADESGTLLARLGSPGFAILVASLTCIAAVPAAFWLADNRLIPWANELRWEQLRAGPASAGAPVADDDFVVMSRGPCFGSCPIYSVKVFASGRVEYLGKAYTCDMGPREGYVDRDKARELIHDLAAAGFFQLDWKPGSWISDAPSASTRLKIGGRSHCIFHDYGDTGAPRMLESMEDAIDEIAGSARWLPIRDDRGAFCPAADGSRLPVTD